ncbi:MAG: hypothetical protein IKA49_02050 [Alistipes sp.]|nr:hypothetical protein [Alistipes sp.]
MKFGRFILLILVGLFVYWAAAYDTFSNFVTSFTDDAQPLAEVVDAKTNKAIDQLNATDMKMLIPHFNKGLLIASCVALALSLLYLVVFRKAAKRRNTYSDIKTYAVLSAVCIVLTLFKQDTANWWAIPTIPVISLVLCYPLLYLPHYRYFRWLFALFFDVLVVVAGSVYVILCLTDAPFLVTIATFVVTILSIWYAWTHRKFDACEKCKKHVEYIYVGRTIDKTEIDYRDFDQQQATGYIVKTTYDKYGHKHSETSTPTGWRRVKGTTKYIKRYYTDLYQCPYCGDEHTTSDVKEDTKSLGYNQREEPTGTYEGDLPNA